MGILITLRVFLREFDEMMEQGRTGKSPVRRDVGLKRVSPRR
ncbi:MULTISPECIES: hypothetical protein [Chelativorans]|jgi:hypothetical protein|nr:MULTISPECIES: hypothetical protein [Chelativorans]